MKRSSSPRLSLLLSRLGDWLPIVEFDNAMKDYFLGERSTAEVVDYRAKRGPLKKLRDEVTPVLHYLRLVRAEGEVRFVLGNTAPDCWTRKDASAEPQGIEVTVAQSREGHHLGRELNEKGIGRGFIGLPDDAPSDAFARKLSSERVAYTSDAVLSTVGGGIKRCLIRKAAEKYAGLDLLVEAPLNLIPEERWDKIKPDLESAAAETHFRRIYVIGERDPPLFGFPIK